MSVATRVSQERFGHRIPMTRAYFKRVMGSDEYFEREENNCFKYNFKKKPKFLPIVIVIEITF